MGLACRWAGPISIRAVPGLQAAARGPARHGPYNNRALAGRAVPGTIRMGRAVPGRAGPFGQLCFIRPALAERAPS